jgi:hypothetical protein
MTKKHSPRVELIEQVEHVLDVELIEQAEHVLDEVEDFWHELTEKKCLYSAVGAPRSGGFAIGGAVLVNPAHLANFLAENPSAKPLQLPRLDRRMLELVKMALGVLESGEPDEVGRFLAQSAATEKPSEERLEKAAEMVARGDLAAYDDGGRLFLIRDEDVDDFERDHPEAKRITSAEQVQEFVERLQKKLRMA